MKAATVFSALALGTTAFAAPSQTLEKRASICGQYDSVTTGTYTLYQDLWGKADATSGSQCSVVNSLSGSTISWTTDWTWTGGTSIKSYANIALDFTSKQLNSINKMVATWDWSYSYSGTIVADVAFDLFTSPTAGGAAKYEIMIWLANYNAGPISSTGSPIHTVTLGGYPFKLYSGPNGDTTVYSFIPTSTIYNFYADIKTFFTYLEGEGLISGTQYLTVLEAGTEATSGSNAVLTTSKYSVALS